MSKFKTDMRVVVIDENNEVRKGVINTVYEDMEIAIVKFDDGNVEKVHFSYLGIEPDTKVQENQAFKTESQEGAKIISKDRFIEAVQYVTSPENILHGKAIENIDPMSLMIKGMAVMCVGMNMVEKLYQDKEEIELTKDQLKDFIAENTNPIEVAKNIDNKMSVSQVLPISILSALILIGIIEILFDDSEND
jgi:hypothetical protein